MIRRMGFRVDQAENGRQAFEAVQRTRYLLVLMDLQMPELDGYEAARRIRRTEKSGSRLPIIACTAGWPDAYRDQYREADMDGHLMDGYLRKPLGLEALTAIVQRWLPHCEESL